MNFKFLFLVMLLVLPPALSNSEERVSWLSVAEEIEDRLEESRASYEEGRSSEAKGMVTDAYFEVFEGKGMETSVSLLRSRERKTELESMFSGIRGAMGAGASPSDIKERIDKLVAALKEDAVKMDRKAEGKKGASPIQLFIDSFIIIVREGFEAILIISALVAYLAKTGHGDKVRRIYLGAVLALLASVATAIILNTIFSVSGPAREGMEGITMLMATAVLFYVSYWLISKAEVGRWQRFIKGKMEAALSGRSLFALSSAAFLAVYREGAETILFYQALLSGSGEGGTAIIMYGFAAGGIILAFVYLAIKYMSLKVPLGPFFALTSILLYYLAFSFAGKGILELQEAAWVSATPVNFPTIHILGIYPTVEGLTLQGLLFAAAIGAGLYTLFSIDRERKAVIGDVSHIGMDIKALHDLLEHIKMDVQASKASWEPLRSAEVAEIQEIKEHMDSLDLKTHEVIEHLTELEKGLTDIFGELEKGMEKGK
jgi:high-affinity iron transporter